MATAVKDDDQDFRDLKCLHDEAFSIIDEAIDLEQQNQIDKAVSKYENGLILIDKALELPFRKRDGEISSQASVMQEKMRKVRKDILSRLAEIQVRNNIPFASPPSYEEAMSDCSPNSIQTYSDLGAALRFIKVETGASTAEIIYKHENVKIYFISPEGVVSSTTEPDTLIIACLEESSSDQNCPRLYLQIGTWVYPLIPGVSPCYRSSFGAFVLPDVHSTVEGAAVGILLPPEADDEVYELLNDILNGIVDSSKKIPQPPPRTKRRTSTTISQGIVSGAQIISNGLVKGASKAGELLNRGTPALIDKLSPNSSPSHINSNVSKGLQTARCVTGTAVSITGFVATKIGAGTMALGRYLAPHIQQQGTKLLTKFTNMGQEEAHEKVGGVLEVASGAVEGFGTIYNGLENSASILGTSLADNTVKVVEHKYGPAAGRVTDDTLNTVGNAISVSRNVRYLTPKGLAKTAVKQTGKAVVENYSYNVKQSYPENDDPSAGTSSKKD